MALHRKPKAYIMELSVETNQNQISFEATFKLSTMFNFALKLLFLSACTRACVIIWKGTTMKPPGLIVVGKRSVDNDGNNE